jgi:hypothetical protein
MAGALLRLLLAALALHLVLIQPNHPNALTWQALFLFPLELPVILLLLIAAGGVLIRPLRAVLTVGVTVLCVLKAVDFAMFTALSRGFNPVADLVLVEAAMRLVSGAIGGVLTALAALGAVLAVIVVASVIWCATGVWAAITPSRSARILSVSGAVLCAGLVVAQIGQATGAWRLPVSPPGAAFTARVGVELAVLVHDTLRELRAFREAAASDPYADRTGLFDRIDRDVLIVFVESYGRTSLDTPYYAETHRDTLQRGAARLDGLGLSTASTLLRAPTQGGQSWLSHATFANGLWVSDQTRYRAVLASGRETLFHIAARSGFHTAAVMPQITLAWPEAEVVGFDTILAAQDLGYEGEPFNWVTMPDQFTYAAMDRLLRAPTKAPVFVQIATGTSHAPWVPVPWLVPWERIGDGQIFNDMAKAGDTPAEVWRDHDRVRAQYRQAIDYALSAVVDYAALHTDDPPLMIVIGDHQAADFVALDERADVPAHVIGPPHLVERISNLGWRAGLIPDPDAPVLGMDRMRNLLIETFSSRSAPDGAGG